MPLFIRTSFAMMRADPLWGIAFFAVLLMPWMLIFDRTGMEICGAIVGLLFLGRSAARREWHWLREPFSVVTLLLIAWLVLVVTPLAVSPAKGAVDALLWFRLPLFLIALRSWVLVSPAARNTLAIMLIALLVPLMIDTLWQMAYGVSLSGNPRIVTGRLTGVFVKPKIGLYIGKMLLPALTICLLLAWGRRGWLLTLAAITLTAIATLLLTGERSVFIVTMLALGLAGSLLMWRHQPMRTPLLIAGGALAALVLTLFFTSEWVQIRANQALQTMGNYPNSDYGLLAGAALDMGREHWLHGAGVHGFRLLCPIFELSGGMFTGLHPHNLFLEWFAETGLPGLLLFCAMIGLLLREAWQHFLAAQGRACIVPALVLAVCLQHFFPLVGMQSVFTNWPAWMLWYPLAIAFSALPKQVKI